MTSPDVALTNASATGELTGCSLDCPKDWSGVSFRRGTAVACNSAVYGHLESDVKTARDTVMMCSDVPEVATVLTSVEAWNFQFCFSC